MKKSWVLPFATVLVLLLLTIWFQFGDLAKLKQWVKPDNLEIGHVKSAQPIAPEMESEVASKLIKVSGIYGVTLSEDRQTFLCEYDPEKLTFHDLETLVSETGISLAPKEQLRVLDVQIKYN